MLKNREVKVLDGTPNYFAIEDIGPLSSEDDFQSLLQETVNYVTKEGIPSVSITLDEKQAADQKLVRILKGAGFKKHAVQYFYKRDLRDLKDINQDFLEIKSIDEVGDIFFEKCWEAASSLSLNAGASLTIDEEFEGMKSELGADYRKSCLVALYKGEVIGVTMPHIEPGTTDEGRLFYFGLVPEYRGKGLAARLHRWSLQYLKELGATHYIGATGHQNLPMQKVFQKNGCRPFGTKVTFRL
ncbi:MAG TPA: GNAT family N-acetyltransferase [Bacillales bacterium]|nr:GNAT family N-acetyltransferase [Bacillales bacterium]